MAAATADTRKEDLPAAASIPDDIRARLTADQMQTLDRLLDRKRADHAIAYRASTAFFGIPIYLALFSGPELRSGQRVAGQRRSPIELLLKLTLIAVMITIIAAMAAIVGLVAVYLAKSFVGIDLFDGPSFLHKYFFD